MKRDIEFLERTAIAVPDKDHKYKGVAVCYGSFYREMSYMLTNGHGSTIPVTRDEAARLLAENQA